ncbi:phosphotransferase [Citreicella sp. C3M06]|nr:phosphotransferase [Citreicella sp. C3M06]
MIWRANWVFCRVVVPTLPLVPQAQLFCDDPKVIGARFFLREYRAGLVAGEEITPDKPMDGPGLIGQFLGGKIVDVLAKLHCGDAQASGLGELGRPKAFALRAQRGSAKRATVSWEQSPPAELGTLLAWLDKHQPVTADPPNLIHNDFKFDSIILDPDPLEPPTLIDWDMHAGRAALRSRRPAQLPDRGGGLRGQAPAVPDAHRPARLSHARGGSSALSQGQRTGFAGPQVLSHAGNAASRRGVPAVLPPHRDRSHRRPRICRFRRSCPRPPALWHGRRQWPPRLTYIVP